MIPLVLALAAGLALVSSPAVGATVSGRPCSAEERARLLAAPVGSDDSVELACSLKLDPQDRVRRRVVIAGARASGVVLDCNGAGIGEPGQAPAPKAYAVEIRATPLGPGPDGTPRWSRPADVRIARCAIFGPVRVWGMGVNGQGEAVRRSSHAPGHTERAQAAAPTRVTIEDSRLVAEGAIPLYLGPGVTESRLVHSQVTGQSVAVAVYLDAESAGNTIDDTDFDIETTRETIAVDGSARNRITRNRFLLRGVGGVYLYRNCGEGGTVRHQTPSDNVVTGNVFRRRGFFRKEAVVVGAREGRRLYCGADAGYPFGSSLDDGDHAERNRVEGNRDE